MSSALRTLAPAISRVRGYRTSAGAGRHERRCHACAPVGRRLSAKALAVRLGWKLFTLLQIVLLPGYFLPPSDHEGWDWYSMATQTLLAVGLVGYSWRVRIARRWVWKLAFVVQIINVILLVIATGFAGSWYRGHPPPQDSRVQMLLLAAGVYVWDAIVAFALYRYAFREESTWVTSNSRLQRPRPREI
jgi:hypothetical protein